MTLVILNLILALCKDEATWKEKNCISTIAISEPTTASQVVLKYSKFGECYVSGTGQSVDLDKFSKCMQGKK